jgi:fructose-1,6-bisphosphatase II / sedoheptulose-1,7-bisphosphatase
MTIKSEYLKLFVNATEKAAYGAFKFVGKNDKIAADQAAVDNMRNEFNKIEMDGKIVIGEGEMDEAPMLFIGERLGTKKGQKIDLAVDPLEGTNFVAKNLPNAFSVLAASEQNNLFFAPDTYMEKIAIGSNLPKNLIDLDNSVEKNISLLAEAKNTTPNQLTVCILERPRHNEIISSLKKMKVNLKLISDGDVSGIINIVDQNSPVDMYIGIGGGPEGVLAAAALSCYGAQMQTRLVLNENESERAKKMGITNLKRKYNIEDMIKGDVMFCATAITDGDLAEGIKDHKEFYETSTIALHKNGKINTLFKNKHKK